MCYFEKGEYVPALDCYNKAIQIDAKNPFHFNNRGMSHYSLKHFVQAEKDFTDAIALDSSNGNYFYNRANARRDNGDVETALGDINKAIELCPTIAEYYHAKGLCYEEMEGLPPSCPFCPTLLSPPLGLSPSSCLHLPPSASLGRAPRLRARARQ
jgi:tetratricopeptide (TPR) repeat protein